MRGRVRLSPVFVFLLCLLIYRGWGREVGYFFLAAILHECGHLVALSLCGCRTWRVSFGLGGAVIETGTMPYAHELVCAAAGPAVNALLLAIPSTTFRFFNLGLLLFNMLPLASLDGYRILSAMLGLFAPRIRQRICGVASVLAAILLLLVGLWCTVWLPYGKTPIVVAAAILVRTCFFQSEGLDKVQFVG